MNLDLKVTGSGPIVDGTASASVDRIVQKRVAEAALAAKETAKSNAPARTGQLRQSIAVEGVGEVVATARYAPFVEFGHIQGKEHPVKVKARPFLYASNVEKAAMDIMGQTTEDITRELG